MVVTTGLHPEVDLIRHSGAGALVPVTADTPLQCVGIHEGDTS